MKDDARALLDHPGNERAVQANRRKQVEVDLVLPVLVGQCEHAPARRTGATHDVHENIESAEALLYLIDHLVRSLARADVGLDEQSHRPALR